MKLFEIDKDWNLKVEDSAWGLLPFKKILDRDKTKNKSTALKEMLFIYYYTDIKSDYMYITDKGARELEIKKDVGLPDKWVFDSVMLTAVEFYEERTTTIIGTLYKSATKAVGDVKDYLEKSNVLLAERNDNGTPIYKIKDITAGLKDVKMIMKDLKAAEKEVIKEKKETEGRMKGSKELGMFEDGLDEV